jgi:hypothetical protein
MSELSELEQQIAVPFPVREKPEGVRILAPTGEIGFVPAEQLEEAIAAGAKVVTPELMKEMRQEIFMQHAIFRDKHQRPKQRKRRSIVRGGRR